MSDQLICIEVPQVKDFCFHSELIENVCTSLGLCFPPAGSTAICTIVPETVRSSLSFDPSVGYPVGGSPQFVTAADFNGDGIADLAVADYGTNSVSVLLGVGDGTFHTAMNYPVDVGPIGIVAADFNKDGRIDLATANFGSNDVSILLGIGDGTFHTVMDFPVSPGVEPQGIVAADFNSDGIIDLATANSASNDVSILLGVGDGTFGTAVDFPVQTFPVLATVADFNGDGIADLAVTNAGSNSVSILLGVGNGTFRMAVNYSAGSTPTGIVAADFNGDGVPDLAVTNNTGRNVSILLGIGDGTFRLAGTYPVGSGPQGVAAADLNCDGIVDLAVASGDFSNVSILLGVGDGTFQPTVDFPLPVGSTPTGIVTADFNGDGKSDLATGDSGSNDVSVLINDTICMRIPTGCAELGRTPPDQSGYSKVSFAVTVGYMLKILSPGGTVICTFLNQTLSLVKTVVLCAQEGVSTVCDLTVNCGPCYPVNDVVCCSFELCLVIKSVVVIILALPGTVLTPSSNPVTPLIRPTVPTRSA